MDLRCDRQFFELYYYQLLDQQSPTGQTPSPASETPNVGFPAVGLETGVGAPMSAAAESELSESMSAPTLVPSDRPPDLLSVYTDPTKSGVENTNPWDRDELLSDRLDELVRMAQANDSWGSIGGWRFLGSL
ncbi:MAG: hypothetical protein GDA43_05685 [Hormoscilla sp. SP5CHS1]|nr:hypothetical protein [Hormoscilla sp. SP12CHS1]MBC6452749.1 hypothetical protein [Hormoscilla sp. SP5CHS1]